MKDVPGLLLDPLRSDGIDLIIRVVCRARGIERLAEVEKKPAKYRLSDRLALLVGFAMKERLLAGDG